MQSAISATDEGKEALNFKLALSAGAITIQTLLTITFHDI